MHFENYSNSSDSEQEENMPGEDGGGAGAQPEHRGHTPKELKKFSGNKDSKYKFSDLILTTYSAARKMGIKDTIKPFLDDLQKNDPKAVSIVHPVEDKAKQPLETLSGLLQDCCEGDAYQISKAAGLDVSFFDLMKRLGERFSISSKSGRSAALCGMFELQSSGKTATAWGGEVREYMQSQLGGKVSPEEIVEGVWLKGLSLSTQRQIVNLRSADDTKTFQELVDAAEEHDGLGPKEDDKHIMNTDVRHRGGKGKPHKLRGGGGGKGNRGKGTSVTKTHTKQSGEGRKKGSNDDELSEESYKKKYEKKRCLKCEEYGHGIGRCPTWKT
jgi:hypothetical protein